MTGKTHLIGGGAAAALLLTVSPAPPVAAAVVGAAALAGSLLPDIDKRGTKVSNKAGLLGSLVRLFTTHRGILHDPTLYIGIYAVLELPGGVSGYQRWAMLGLLAGILSHILLDALTVMGVPVLLFDLLRLPFDGKLKRRKYRLLKLATGGAGEWLTAALLSAGGGYLLLTLF